MGDDRQDVQRARPEETPDSTQANPETVKLILDHKKDDPREQLRDSEQLDTKIAGVFAAATVLVGFAVRLPQREEFVLRFVAGQWTDTPSTLQVSLMDLLVWLVAASWFVAALCVVLHLLTRTYSRPLEAGVLWETYRSREPGDVRMILVRDIARADEHNRQLLKRKARLLNAAVIATGLESLFLVLALVLAR